MGNEQENIDIDLESEIVKNQESINGLSAEENKELEDQAVEITKNIVNSVKVKEEDKKSFNATELEGFQNEFDAFLNKKIDVDNSRGGDYDKIPTGIDIIDCLTGGGFTVGQFTQVVGLPGSFKSTLVAQILGNAQRYYEGKMICTYYDTEVAMTSKRLAQLGVNCPKIKPYDDITIEQLFQTIEAMCAYKEAKNITIPSVIVWDSIANTSTLKERSTDEINQTMGLKQKLLSQLMPRYASKMLRYRICLWGINQLRDKLDVGMYGPPADLKGLGSFDIPGGKAIKFNCTTLLKLQNRGELKEDQYGFRGFELEGVFIKNKGFTPHIKFTMLADFSKGINNFFTNYKLLAEYKRLSTGAWNKLEALPEVKFRTKDAEEVYKTNDKFREVFDSEVKDVLKTQFTDKYE